MRLRAFFWHRGCVLIKPRENGFLQKKRSKAGKKVFLQTFTVALALAVPFVSYGNDLDCSAQFGALSGAIDSASYTSDRDPTQLQGKVTEASSKLTLDKYADAEQKVVNTSDKVKALRDARKPKIFDDTSTSRNEIEAILVAVDDALTCMPGGLDSLPH